MCFSPYIGIASRGGGGGGPQGMGTQLAYGVFYSRYLKKRSFQFLFFSYSNHFKSPFRICKAFFSPYLCCLCPILGLPKAIEFFTFGVFWKPYCPWNGFL